MRYFSQAWQDEFVANILSFKRDGHFLDIGSNYPTILNNSYYFELELNWHGICVEIQDFVSDYKSRTCHFVHGDAIQIDYGRIFNETNYPKRSDYLSIDIDEGSASALEKIPLNDYRFNVITIEHNHADKKQIPIRDIQRETLTKCNYFLLFPDVLVPIECGIGPDLSFEDWWIDPAVFDISKLQSLKKSITRFYPSDIVAVLKNMKNTYYLGD